ncbi:enolase C-terminal domain-like protein [Phytoactinopolyspora limicola]|uniref:enolase C-terminal domain-like protein n=1 Tax=Phytoactinopolyspora limicola TaxID=2715536 RepID=UPI001A9C98C4|nr:enolase C-terminal domain-like protein [Phytoactinopolyspora limicola]
MTVSTPRPEISMAGEVEVPTAAPPWPHRDGTRITAVRAIATAPAGTPLVVVRVDTNEPGLYGLGCATFTQRWEAVVAYVEQHVARIVVGRHPADIEDITRSVGYAAYWRHGPVGNNAISGLDMALWDIAGKRAGLPVYELLGGRVRSAVPTYTHAGRATVEETLADARGFIDAGWTHVRLQVGQPGRGTYGAPGSRGGYPAAAHPDGWDVRHYLRTTPELFAQARAELGDGIELLHDVHSRLTPKEAVILARSLEPYRLFFLEDVLAPEYFDRLPEVRAASPVPIAVGELATSFVEAVRLVRDGGVDLIRCHISAIGGLTPARKLAVLSELTGVRTAWHSPADVSPVGAAANVALDVSSPAFGIQEGHVYPDPVHEVFPGTLRIERGWMRPNETPGWGIDVDEGAAAAYPAGRSGHDAWALGVRAPDGSILPP